MKKNLYLRWLSALTVSVAIAIVWNANDSPRAATERFPPAEVARFAANVQAVLSRNNARVAILARMGRPLSELPDGIHFTHVAFAVASDANTRESEYRVYNLYQRADRLDVSELIEDSSVEFFSNVVRLEAGILIPSPEIQARLLRVIKSPVYAKLHEPRYSFIANPYTEGRQNCTEFTLDVITSALTGTSDIHSVKAYERLNFEAQTITVSPWKLRVKSMLSDEVSMSDHTGAPKTATFEKIAAYVIRHDSMARVLTLTEP